MLFVSSILWISVTRNELIRAEWKVTICYNVLIAKLFIYDHFKIIACLSLVFLQCYSIFNNATLNLLAYSCICKLQSFLNLFLSSNLNIN
jgi:hypothetical protein